jgi:hypothetical protein
LLIICLLPAIARAQVGKRNYIEPLIADDPNPGNELDLIPSWVAIAEGSNFSFNFSLEKTLSENFSLELGNAWNDPSCNPGFICLGAGSSRRGRSRHRQPNSNNFSQQLLSGFDDLEVLPKYAFSAPTTTRRDWLSAWIRFFRSVTRLLAAQRMHHWVRFLCSQRD